MQAGGREAVAGVELRAGRDGQAQGVGGGLGLDDDPQGRLAVGVGAVDVGLGEDELEKGGTQLDGGGQRGFALGVARHDVRPGGYEDPRGLGVALADRLDEGGPARLVAGVYLRVGREEIALDVVGPRLDRLGERGRPAVVAGVGIGPL